MKKTQVFNKITFLIIISGLCTFSSVAFSGNNIDETDLANSFEQRLKTNLQLSPMTRQMASIQFVSPKDTSDLAQWAELNSIDILSLTGKVVIGGKTISITLADTGAYDAPIEQVIRTQLSVYHQQHLDLSIARKKEQLSQLHSTKDQAAVSA